MSHDFSTEHSSFKEWLYLEADGELGPQARRRLDRHLAACRECRHERRQIGGLEALLFEAVVPVEEDFARRVLQQLPEAGWEARSFSGWRLALVVFAILSTASVFLGLGSDGLASEVPLLGAAAALAGLFRSALVAGGGLLAASWTGIGMALDGLFEGSRIGLAVFGALVLGIDLLFVRALLRSRARVEQESAGKDAQ